VAPEVDCAAAGILESSGMAMPGGAAQALFRSQSWLGQYFRRMRAKLGAPKAIIAAAHKLARIVFHMLTTGQAYDETVFAQPEVQNNRRMQQRIRQQAKQFGFQLVEITAQ
jgi:hypothetical protein